MLRLCKNTYNRIKQSEGADYPQRIREFGFASDSKKAIESKKYRRFTRKFYQ
jgi:hypothetical protein